MLHKESHGLLECFPCQNTQWYGIDWLQFDGKRKRQFCPKWLPGVFLSKEGIGVLRVFPSSYSPKILTTLEALLPMVNNTIKRSNPFCHVHPPMLFWQQAPTMLYDLVHDLGIRPHCCNRRTIVTYCSWQNMNVNMWNFCPASSHREQER